MPQGEALLLPLPLDELVALEEPVADEEELEESVAAWRRRARRRGRGAPVRGAAVIGALALMAAHSKRARNKRMVPSRRRRTGSRAAAA